MKRFWCTLTQGSVFKARTHVSTVFRVWQPVPGGDLHLPSAQAGTLWRESCALCAHTAPAHSLGAAHHERACFGIPLNFLGFLKHSFNTALLFHFRSKGAGAIY